MGKSRITAESKPPAGDAPAPVTDSPFFWLFLFATSGLILLVVVNPKYGRRQAQIERQFQARERIAETARSGVATTSVSTPDSTLITLWPLFVVLAVLSSVAWYVVWRRLLAARRIAGG